MKNILITEGQLRHLLYESTIDNIISYVKGFGSKGKLGSCDISLKEYYKSYEEDAFNWIKENGEVDRDLHSFPYFDWYWRINAVSNFVINKRGLIYVERDITLGDVNEVNYNSIGECWSWKKSNGKAYCSDFGLFDSVDTVKLCGYVHPESVDWLETIYLNTYHMNNETEIRMSDNAVVEVSYILVNGVKYKLGGSYLINASSDKYRKKDW